MGQSNNAAGCIGVIVCGIGLVIALILILVPLSLKPLEYYEYGFRRRTTTGYVDKSHVYGEGLHLIGPDYAFKTFKASAHYIYLQQVSVFASDRLQVEISANFQYFIRRHQLVYLHDKFDTKYESIIRTNALDALKGASTIFSTREFIHKRMQVEEHMFKAVRERLGGICCEQGCNNVTAFDNKRSPMGCWPGCKPYKNCQEADYGLFVEVRYFQLHELSIPSEINERFLQTLVLGESTLSEKLLQNATITRQQTDALAKQIENEAVEVSENARASSDLLVSRAQADAMAMREKARSSGLRKLYEQLDLNTVDQKLAFDYLKTMRKATHTNIAIDYNQLVSFAKN